MTKIARRITAVLLAGILVLGSAMSLMAAEPVRDTFEAAGAEVSWDYDNRLIVIEIMDSTIVLEPGSNIALINGAPLQLSQPVFIENDISFIEMDDLQALSLALLGLEPVEGEHGTTVATMQAIAVQLVELMNVPDFSMAFVNANTGFNWTSTMSDATDADTIFHLGSIGKTFTAVAVMQLVEQGLLNLDTPIVEYLPNFSALPSEDGEGNYRNITVRMLLSHTAGIATDDWGTGALTTGDHYQRHMNEFLDRFANTRMVRQEGTAYEYANNGFVILGILVAHIAGHENYFEGFNQHLLENVFEPMGLTRTSFAITPELRPYVAPAYMMAGIPREFYYPNALSTGSIFSTANEMVSLMTMFLNDGYYNGHQILTPASVDQMFTPQAPATSYGLGVAFMPDPSGTGVIMEGHNGGLIHSFASMSISREHGIGAFSVSNSTLSGVVANMAIAGAALATAITELGGELTPPVQLGQPDPTATPIELTEEEMEAITGLYLVDGGLVYSLVELVDGQLFFIVPAQGLNELLIPMSDGRFDIGIGLSFWFITDGDGGMSIAQNTRYTIVGQREDYTRFIPDEDFMENWYGFTFVATGEDFYVFMIPYMTFGITEEGLAYSGATIINMPPGMTLRVLEPMDTDIELQHEDGQYFFEYFGTRFVRQ